MICIPTHSRECTVHKATHDDKSEESNKVENLCHRLSQANRDKQLLRLCIEELEKRMEFTKLKLFLKNLRLSEQMLRDR